MNFDDTPEEAAFRADVKTWLAANATQKTAVTDNRWSGHDRDAVLAISKQWQAKKAEAGYVGITWPKTFGGRELPPIMQVIYNQEEADYAAPNAIFRIGLGMCIPTMMKYATDEQNARYVPNAMRGEEIWCQLFSEPASGSDLAGLRTRAERDGDDWVINGQKIWTSGAQYCDFGILVTRSDFEAPKHKGLTFFFLDMKSPGVEIRPIRQISGASNFNEVYFTDVRIPDSQRLGAVGEGWKVSLTTLMNERLAVGDAPPPGFDELFELVRSVDFEDGPAIKNAAVREKLADWYAQHQGLKFTHFRTLSALSRGETPGPEASIGKVVSARNLQDIASFGMDLQDMAGVITDGDLVAMNAVFEEAYLHSPGFRIAGGSDEILRNIIAERVLGLPQDVRVDKELPFNALPTGTKKG